MIIQDTISGYVQYPNDPTHGIEGLEHRGDEGWVRPGDLADLLIFFPPVAATAMKFGKGVRSYVRTRYYAAMRQYFTPETTAISNIGYNQSTIAEEARRFARSRETFERFEEMSKSFPNADRRLLMRAARILEDVPRSGHSQTSIIAGNNLSNVRSLVSGEGAAHVDDARATTQKYVVQVQNVVPSPKKARTYESLKGSTKRIYDFLNRRVNELGGQITESTEPEKGIVEIKFRVNNMTHELRLPDFGDDITIARNPQAQFRSAETFHELIERAANQIPYYRNERGQWIINMWSARVSSDFNMANKGIMISTPGQEFEEKFYQMFDDERFRNRILSGGAMSRQAMRKFENEVIYQGNNFNMTIDNPHEESLGKLRKLVKFGDFELQEKMAQTQMLFDEFTGSREAMKQLRGVQKNYVDAVTHFIENRSVRMKDAQTGEWVEVPLTKKDSLGNTVGHSRLFEPQVSSASSATRYHLSLADPFVSTAGGEPATPHIFARASILPGISSNPVSRLDQATVATNALASSTAKYNESLVRYTLDALPQAQTRGVGGPTGLAPMGVAPYGMTMVNEKLVPSVLKESGFVIAKGQGGIPQNFRDLIEMFGGNERRASETINILRPEKVPSVTLDGDKAIIEHHQKPAHVAGSLSQQRKVIQQLRQRIVNHARQGRAAIDLSKAEADLILPSESRSLHHRNKHGGYTVFFEIEKMNDIKQSTGSVKFKVYTQDNATSIFFRSAKLAQKQTTQVMRPEILEQMELSRDDTYKPMVNLIKSSIETGSDIVTNTLLQDKRFSTQVTAGLYMKMLDNVFLRATPEHMMSHADHNGFRTISDKRAIKLANDMLEAFMGKEPSKDPDIGDLIFKELESDQYMIAPESQANRRKRLAFGNRVIREILVPENPYDHVRVVLKDNKTINLGDLLPYEHFIQDKDEAKNVQENIRRSLIEYRKTLVEARSDREDIPRAMERIKEIEKHPLVMELNETLDSSDIKKGEKAPGSKYVAPIVVERNKDGSYTLLRTDIVSTTGIPTGGIQELVTGRGQIGVKGISGAPTLGSLEFLSIEPRHKSYTEHVKLAMEDKIRAVEAPSLHAALMNRMVYEGGDIQKALGVEGPSKARATYQKLLDTVRNISGFKETIDGTHVKTTFGELIDTSMREAATEISGLYDDPQSRQRLAAKNQLFGSNMSNMEDEITRIIQETVDSHTSRFTLDDDGYKQLMNMADTLGTKGMKPFRVMNQDMLAIDLGMDVPVTDPSTGAPRFTRTVYGRFFQKRDFGNTNIILQGMDNQLDKELVRKAVVHETRGYARSVLSLVGMLGVSRDLEKQASPVNQLLMEHEKGLHTMVTTAMKSAVSHKARNVRKNIEEETSGKKRMGGMFKMRRPYSMYAQISNASMFRGIGNKLEAGTLYITEETFDKMTMGSMVGLNQAMKGIDEKLGIHIRESLQEKYKSAYFKMLDRNGNYRSHVSTAQSKHLVGEFTRKQKAFSELILDTVMNDYATTDIDRAPGRLWSKRMRELKAILKDPEISSTERSRVQEQLTELSGKKPSFKPSIEHFDSASRKQIAWLNPLQEAYKNNTRVLQNLQTIADTQKEYLRRMAEGKVTKRKTMAKQILNAWEEIRSSVLNSREYQMTGSVFQDKETKQAFNKFKRMVRTIEAGRDIVTRLTGKTVKSWSLEEHQGKLWNEVMDNRFMKIFMNSRNIKRRMAKEGKRLTMQDGMKVIYNNGKPINTQVWDDKAAFVNDQLGKNVRMFDTYARALQERLGKGKLPTLKNIENVMKMVRRIGSGDLDLGLPEEKLRAFTEDMASNMKLLEGAKEQLDKVSQMKRMLMSGGFGGYLQAQPNLTTTHGSSYVVKIVHQGMVDELMGVHDKSVDETTRKKRREAATNLLKTMEGGAERIFMNATSAFLHDRDFDGDAVSLFMQMVDEKWGGPESHQLVADDLSSYMYDKTFVRSGGKLIPMNYASAKWLDNLTNTGPQIAGEIEFETLKEYTSRSRVRSKLKEMGFSGEELARQEQQAVKRLEDYVAKLRKTMPGGDRVTSEEALDNIVIYKSHKGVDVVSQKGPKGAPDYTNVRVQSTNGSFSPYEVKRKGLNFVEGYLKQIPEYKDASTTHLEHFENLQQSMDNLMKRLEQRMGTIKEETRTFYENALNNLSKGPAATESFFIQKTSTQYLYKYVYFSRMFSAAIRDTNTQMADAMAGMAERFWYLMEQMPGIQGKKGVPNIESDIHNIFNYMSKGMDPSGWVQRESYDLARERMQQFKEKILRGDIGVSISQSEQELLEKTGFTKIFPQQTVNTIGFYHQAKTEIAATVLENWNQKTDIESTMLHGGKTFNVLNDSEVERLTEDLYEKYLKATNDKEILPGVQGDKRVGKAKKAQLRKFIQNTGNEVVWTDARNQMLRLAPTEKMTPEHSKAAVRAVADVSALNYKKGKSFLGKLLNITTSEMNVSQKLVSEAKRTGLLQDMQGSYNLVMRTNPAIFHQDSFATELYKNMERELATGRRDNVMNKFIKQVMPPETYDLAVRMAKHKRGHRIFHQMAGKGRPISFGGTGIIPTMTKVGIGLTAMAALAPNPTVGKSVDAVRDKRSEYDMDLPKNMLTQTNNRAVVSHVPHWVQQKIDKINRGKIQYASQFYQTVDPSLREHMAG